MERRDEMAGGGGRQQQKDKCLKGYILVYLIFHYQGALIDKGIGCTVCLCVSGNKYSLQS